MAGGSDLRKQLDELRKIHRENKRSIREAGTLKPSRLGSGIGGGIGGSGSSSPPPTTTPPPVKDDDKANMPGLPGGSPKYTGVPKRSEGQFDDGFDAWVAQLDNVMMFMPTQAYNAQIRAAEAVAGAFRVKLARGDFGDIELSPLTIALGGGTRRRPLSGLAKRVMVFKPKQARRNHRKATPGSPGTAGVFTGEFEPAYVGFDKAWDHRAFQLDKGYMIKISAVNARKIMYRAKAVSGWGKIGDGLTSLVDPNTQMKIWYVPGRDFSSWLFGPEAENIVKATADAHFGGPTSETEDPELLKAKWEDILAESNAAMGGGHANWDEVDGTIAADTLNAEEMMVLAADDRFSEDWDD